MLQTKFLPDRLTASENPAFWGCSWQTFWLLSHAFFPRSLHVNEQVRHYKHVRPFVEGEVWRLQRSALFTVKRQLLRLCVDERWESWEFWPFSLRDLNLISKKCNKKTKQKNLHSNEHLSFCGIPTFFISVELWSQMSSWSSSVHWRRQWRCGWSKPIYEIVVTHNCSRR